MRLTTAYKVICMRRCKVAGSRQQRKALARDSDGALRLGFEAVRVRANNTYNAYRSNQLYNLYNECTCCLCLCLGLRTGSDSDKGVAAGWPPPGGPFRSTGKNTRSSRVTSALWAFVLTFLYGKNVLVLFGIE